MNSFFTNIFEYFPQEAANLSQYNKTPAITSKGDSNSSQFEIAWQFVKHGVSESIKAVTKFTSAFPELSMVFNNTNTLLKLF
jgi:hypothetical protein